MKLKCPSLAAGCLALALTGCERAATGEPLPIYDRPQVALLVVDLQKELLGPGGRQAVAPSQVAAMLVATNRLVENARSLGVELVYVRSEAPAGGDLDLRLEHPSAPVFWNDEIDVLACPDCGGRLRVLATIEDPVVVRRILSHLGVPSECRQPLPARSPRSAPESFDFRHD